jgi:hypothetical protein
LALSVLASISLPAAADDSMQPFIPELLQSILAAGFSGFVSRYVGEILFYFIIYLFFCEFEFEFEFEFEYIILNIQILNLFSFDFFFQFFFESN